MLLKLTYCVLLVFYPLIVTSQFAIDSTIFIHQIKSKSEQPKGIKIDFNDSLTSIAFQTISPGTFNGSYLIANADTFYLSDDCAVSENGNKVYSNLVVFKSPVKKITLYPIAFSGQTTIFLINSGKTIKLKSQKKTNNLNCIEPSTIDQDIWRDGLPSPDYLRIIHYVKNIIIHHSATSNDLGNYQDIVRNIYLYHTGSRGWSDIGYNYLVAPDGTIFKGRDPDVYYQDDVMGAHFCASNTGTMGICVMGTYTNVSPNNEAIASMEKLVAWKTNKDNLSPLGINWHLLNENLKVIAGHRDGCSTLCPGEKLYNLLPDVRENVNTLTQNCSPTIINYTNENPTSIIFQNNAIFFTCNTEILNAKIIDISGRIVKSRNFNKTKSSSINVPNITTGIYFVQLFSAQEIFSRKIYIH